MTARILVVDDIPANVKLLEARLMAEYYEVLTAADGIMSAEELDAERGGAAGDGVEGVLDLHELARRREGREREAVRRLRHVCVPLLLPL